MSEILQLFTFFLFTFLGLELAFYSTNYAKTYKYMDDTYNYNYSFIPNNPGETNNTYKFEYDYETNNYVCCVKRNAGTIIKI